MQSRIIQFGMPRTGTTFIHQVLTTIFPGTPVIKTHGYVAEYNQDTVIATYRDLRAVTVSRWRCTSNIIPGTMLSGDVLDRQVKTTKRQSAEYLRYYLNPEILHLKYENFLNNFDYVFEAVESRIKVKIDDVLKDKARNECNIEANKKISDDLKTFSVWDKSNLIHGNHIYKGSIDSWRDFLSNEDQKRITEMLKPDMKKWGYDLSME